MSSPVTKLLDEDELDVVNEVSAVDEELSIEVVLLKKGEDDAVEELSEATIQC